MLFMNHVGYFWTCHFTGYLSSPGEEGVAFGYNDGEMSDTGKVPDFQLHISSAVYFSSDSKDVCEFNLQEKVRHMLVKMIIE